MKMEMKMKMKMKMLTAVVAFGSLSMVNVASAERTARAEVLSVFANANGSATVRVATTEDVNGNVCSSIGRYTISGAAAGRNGLLASALTASATGAEVQLDIASCATDANILNFIVY